ncbi:hypothetical protein ACLOJK_009041 [Asimina triloba]
MKSGTPSSLFLVSTDSYCSPVIAPSLAGLARRPHPEVVVSYHITLAANCGEEFTRLRGPLAFYTVQDTLLALAADLDGET